MDPLDITLLSFMAIGTLMMIIAKWLSPSRAEYQAMQQRNRPDKQESVPPDTEISAAVEADHIGTIH